MPLDQWRSSTPSDEELKVMQREVNRIAKPYRTKPDFLWSLCFLARDIVYIVAYAALISAVKPYVPMALLVPFYSVTMGTIMLGPWVLGHECGHGAFGATQWQNGLVGWLCHSALLVPFWSWAYSHNKHHKYTNHLVLGETHVPNMEGDPVVGDAFPLLRLIGMHVGFPAYLLGFSRARTQADLKTPINRSLLADHFHNGSQTMPTGDWRIELSTVGCILWLCVLGWANQYISIGFWYLGPYLIVNAWLVLYTWLHHTHPDVPHHGPDVFSFIRGAICTIDRPYPWLIDHLHHHIGSTHVAHHLCSDVPHYRAEKLREELKPVLGKYYLFDPTPMHAAVWEVAHACHHVTSLDGTQFYRSKDHKVSKSQ